MADTADYVDANGITVTSVTSHGLQNFEGWECRHDTVTLGLSGRTLTTEWRRGKDVTERPQDQAAEVLDSLVQDASSVTTTDGFRDWAADLDYDADSPQARTTYEKCVAVVADLEVFLGSTTELDHLIHDYDRL